MLFRSVEITTSKVRRERMGHVELAAPVSHIWYFRAIPSRMGLLLNISPKLLEKVLYFAQYIVTDPGETPLAKYQLLNEQQYREYREKYEDDFEAGMGAEAIEKLLSELDLEEEAARLKKELITAQGQRKVRDIKRLEFLSPFLWRATPLEKRRERWVFFPDRSEEHTSELQSR